MRYCDCPSSRCAAAVGCTLARGCPKGVKGAGGVRDAHRNERSRGRSLLRGQDMGNTQHHRNSVKEWLAVSSGWRLAVGGPWGLALRAVLNKKKSGFSKTGLHWRSTTRSWLESPIGHVWGTDPHPSMEGGQTHTPIPAPPAPRAVLEGGWGGRLKGGFKGGCSSGYWRLDRGFSVLAVANRLECKWGADRCGWECN